MQTSVESVDVFDLNAYLVDLPTQLTLPSFNPLKHIRANGNRSTRNAIAERLNHLNEKNAAKLDVFVYEVVKYGTKSRVFKNENDCSDFMHEWNLNKNSIQTCAYEEEDTKSAALKELAEIMVAGPLKRMASYNSGVTYPQAMHRLQKNTQFKRLGFINRWRPSARSSHHISVGNVVPSAKSSKSAKSAKQATPAAKQATPAQKQNAKHGLFGNTYKSKEEKQQDRSARKAVKATAKADRVAKAKDKAAKK